MNHPISWTINPISEDRLEMGKGDPSGRTYSSLTHENEIHSATDSPSEATVQCSGGWCMENKEWLPRKYIMIGKAVPNSLMAGFAHLVRLISITWCVIEIMISRCDLNIT